MVLVLTRQRPIEFTLAVKGSIDIVREDTGEILYTFLTLEKATKLVPPGKYKLVYEYSPKFKDMLWEIEGQNEKKFHKGNSVNDTEGCILPGVYFYNDFIVKSGTALRRMHEILKVNEDHWLIINK